MASLNFVERHIYKFEEKVLPEAKRRGIGVIAMKVLGGPLNGQTKPRLADPESYRATLRYVWGLPEVAVAIIGMRNLDEVRQGVMAARSYQPFSSAESAQLTEKGKTLARQWGELRGPVA
jgi:predicted aldo/keto reductase-like oxidoreductase